MNIALRKVSRVYLDVIEGKEPDHGVVLSLVPISVDLATNEDEVTAPEGQFPGRLPDKVVQSPGH